MTSRLSMPSPAAVSTTSTSYSTTGGRTSWAKVDPPRGLQRKNTGRRQRGPHQPDQSRTQYRHDHPSDRVQSSCEPAQCGGGARAARAVARRGRRLRVRRLRAVPKTDSGWSPRRSEPCRRRFRAGRDNRNRPDARWQARFAPEARSPDWPMARAGCCS